MHACGDLPPVVCHPGASAFSRAEAGDVHRLGVRDCYLDAKPAVGLLSDLVAGPKVRMLFVHGLLYGVVAGGIHAHLATNQRQACQPSSQASRSLGLFAPSAP